MKHPNVSLLWREPEIAGRFRSAVCLHGHTLHSEENLSFLPRYLHCVPGISQIVRSYERGSKRADFSRAYWTPPLTPASAPTTAMLQFFASPGLRVALRYLLSRLEVRP
jgi:hypothetical protein